MGSRFGDTEHAQEVPDYFTVDGTLGYRHALPRGTLSATLTVANLLDRTTSASSTQATTSS